MNCQLMGKRQISPLFRFMNALNLTAQKSRLIEGILVEVSYFIYRFCK